MQSAGNERAQREARIHAIRRILRNRRGVTLVEIMVVIAIVLTLMGVVGYGVMQVFGDAQVETTKLTIGRVNERVQIYTVKKKKPPTTSEGLSAVYSGEPVPTDAWGNELVYVSPGPNGLDYDIISFGKDGKEGGTGNAADVKLSGMD